MKNLYTLLTLLLVCYFTNAQQTSNTVYSRDTSNNEVGINKSYAVTSPYQTGQQFTYTISVSTQGSVGTFTIEDALDVPPLTFITWSHSAPSSFGLSFVRTGNTFTWTGTPPSSSGYTFDIQVLVRFPSGTICGGTIALNSVSIETTSLSKVTTNPISIEAESIDDWSITKTATRGTKIYGLNEIVEYRIVISGGGAIGRHGLTNVTIQDILPLNAVLVGNSTCSYSTLSPSTNTCIVKVRYPSAFFPAGSTVTNTIVLTGENPCGEIITVSDTETITIQDIPVIVTPGAAITKSYSVNNKVPGCSGSYTITMTNDGDTDLSDLELNDTFPTSFITVNSIKINNLSSNNIIYKIGSNPWSLPTTAPVINVAGGNSISIKPAVGSFILSGASISVEVFFTIKAGVNVGDLVLNTVKLDSNSANIHKQASANFTIEKFKPKITVAKTVCNHNPNYIYEPGDELVYRVKITNSGSHPFINGALEDILDPKLDFLGVSHVKIYTSSTSPNCSNNGALDSAATDLTASSTINFNNTTNKLSVSLPTINAGCQFPIESIWIEYRVKVKPGVQSGRIFNTARVFNADISKSATRVIDIKELYTLRVNKLISIDGGANFSAGPMLIPAGTLIQYKIEVENMGNNIYSTLNIIDGLPNPGDIFLANSATPISRGSTVGCVLMSPVIVPLGYQVYYSTSSIPDTTVELGYASPGAIPAGWTTIFNPLAKSIKIALIGGTFNPLDIISIIVNTEVPPNGTVGDVMCNSVKVRGVPLNNHITPASGAGPVCIEVLESDYEECCKWDLDFEDKGSGYFGTDYTRIHHKFEIIGNPMPLIPITEMRVAMSDISITYDYEDCSKCIDDPKLWGSMEGINNIGTGMADTMLFKDSQVYLSNSNHGYREVIWSKWSGSVGRMLQQGDALEFYSYLPPKSKIPCCATAIEVCYTITWKDANCNVCEKTICRTIDLSGQEKKN